MTLLRHGKGMGPTAVLLSTAQFPHVAQIEWLSKQGNILRGRNITICPRRILQLPMNSIAIAPVDLSFCTQHSGLCGALNQPLHTMSHYSEIIKQLDCWYCGMTPDWSWLIGCGPGLTPSGDDMLTGMLAVLYAAGFSEQLQYFFTSGGSAGKTHYISKLQLFEQRQSGRVFYISAEGHTRFTTGA